MKNQVLFFLSCGIALLSLQVNAQLDNNSNKKKKGISTGFLAAPAKASKKPTSLGFKNKSGFKNAYKKKQQKINKKQAEIAFNNKGIITPALQRKFALQKNIEKHSFEIPMIDKDLGIFRTKSKNININAYDFGLEDGDVISIHVNGNPIKESYTLPRNSSLISFPISLGFNRVEIKAINEGKFRPNTGAFTVYDDFGDIVISDGWTLAKGAKVIALIIREKDSK